MSDELAVVKGQNWHEPRELEADERDRFLEYVKAHPLCSVKEACDNTPGVRRGDVKLMRKQSPEFEEEYRTARGYGAEQVYGSMVKLAITGVEKPLVSAGKLVKDDDGEVVYVREYSDRLLGMMFQGLTDEGRRMLGNKLEITGADGGPVVVQRGVSLADVGALLLQVGAIPQPQAELEDAAEVVAVEDVAAE